MFNKALQVIFTLYVRYIFLLTYIYITISEAMTRLFSHKHFTLCTNCYKRKKTIYSIMEGSIIHKQYQLTRTRCVPLKNN